ncbi:HET-domain-containing protein [Xylaria telfairii]|nr:HET-domain-containing protein [Xylaria telfairii]
MRLIETRSGNFAIQEFVGRIPPYAILSHTWGKEEVTLQDMQSALELAKGKLGFSKIKGCCELARRKNIDYVWIDTCCIDKTNSAELSEAINSMFRWYRDSEVCFVFLSDVPSGYRVERDEFDPSSPFSRSRWFSRGWTLQELLAPWSIEFYTSDWGVLGTGMSLKSQLACITGIRPDVFFWRSSRAGLSGYSIAERMSWAAKRNTTRIEDRAYSLLGIFNVNMPLIYGEGLNAFRRLQNEIIKLREDYSILAWGNAVTKNTIPYDDPCGVLSRSPSAFQADHSEDHSKFQWDSEVVVPPNGDEIIPPMSMTSRGLLVSVHLIYHIFGGRTFCLAIIGYRQYGNMVCIPLRQISRGGVFLRLCLGGDYGGFVYVDRYSDFRKSPCTSIYIRRWDDESQIVTDFNVSFLTVRPKITSFCIACMEPIPIFRYGTLSETERRYKNGPILTGNELIFTRINKPPDELQLTRPEGVKFIIPFIATGGAIFCIMLHTDHFDVFPYTGPASTDGENTASSWRGRLNRAVEEMYRDGHGFIGASVGGGWYKVSSEPGSKRKYIITLDIMLTQTGQDGSIGYQF